jgi:mono/diheme cytochrome c family protein
VALSLANKSAAEVEAIGTGSYLVNVIGDCNGCHDQIIAGNPPTIVHMGGGLAFPLGPGISVYARNLTPSPTGMKLTEAQFIESIETGKDFAAPTEGMLVMPWWELRWMSNADKKAIYAYLKAIPAATNTPPPDVKGALAGPPGMVPTSYNEGDVDRPLPSAGVPDPNNVLRGLAIQPLAQPVGFNSLSVADQALFGRGSYLVNSAAHCSSCHTNPSRNFVPGPNFGKIPTDRYLTGGFVYTLPFGLNAQLGQTRTMSANLIGDANGYFSTPTGSTFQGYLRTIYEGKDFETAGNPGLGWPMAWDKYRKMVSEDQAAIYTYLSNVTKVTGAGDKNTQRPAKHCASNAQCTGGGETCNTTTNECVGKACIVDGDCGACQVCNVDVCEAPATSSLCPATGLQ